MTTTVKPGQEYFPVGMTTPDGGEWRPITDPRFESGYQISLYGEVMSPKNRMVKTQIRNGHLQVAMRRRGVASSTTVRVDELVLNTFVPTERDMMPEHIDDDATNCQLINLKWREPTEREQRFKKSAATARQNRGKKTASPAAAKPKKATSVAPLRPTTEVEMMRVYRAAGISVPVTPTGEIPAKGLPKGKLTVRQVAALAKILAAVVEMNTFMGVGN